MLQFLNDLLQYTELFGIESIISNSSDTVSARNMATCLLEIGNTFEQWSGCQVASDMQNTASFVQAFHTLVDLLFKDIQIPGEFFFRQCFPGSQEMFHFTEYPGASDTSATDHNTIYSVIVETLFAYFGRGHIAVADNGDMYPGIIFTSPISVQSASPVYIWARGTAMDGKGGDATIL